MNDSRHDRALVSQFHVIRFSLCEKIPLTAGMLFRWFHSLNVPKDFEMAVEFDPDLDETNIEAYLKIVAL